MYNTSQYIPTVFHNLSRYDAHLFIRELGKKFDTGKMIAENKEKYISFNVNVVVGSYLDGSGEVKEKKIQVRFMDSMRLMASSLDSLMNNLVGDGRKLTGFEDYTDEQYELLIRKGVYQYEYMSSWDKFNETVPPPKEVFYSELDMSDISDKDHEHVQRVWEGFDMRNLGECYDLYLRTDDLLPGNVFEAFRNTCLKRYGLDPAHFYTSPGLAWKVCLKHTSVWLELLTNPDMLLMFERGIRGGITQAVHQYADANHKYMRNLIPKKRAASYSI